MPSVKGNVVWTTQATASASRMRSVSAFHFRTLRVSYRHRVSRQMLSGQLVPQHLPSRQGVSGHYSFWTPSVKVNLVRAIQATASTLRTMPTMASTLGTRSVRALFLPDAKCQGKCHPYVTSHGICLPDKHCHGILVQDTACPLGKKYFTLGACTCFQSL